MPMFDPWWSVSGRRLAVVARYDIWQNIFNIVGVGTENGHEKLAVILST